MSLAVKPKQKSARSSGGGCKQISWTMFAGSGVPRASCLIPSGLPKPQVQETLPSPFLLVFLLVASSSVPSEGRKSLKAQCPVFAVHAGWLSQCLQFLLLCRMETHRWTDR